MDYTQRPAPSLVVSDVDGTLITSAERVSPRLRRCVQRLLRAGSSFALATGRPARWVLPVIEQLGVRPYAVCANGAVVYDSAADRILHSAVLQPEAMREVVARARAATTDVGGVTCGAERAGRSAFDGQGELYCVEPDFVHAWDSEEHNVLPPDQLTAEPAVKLLLRSEQLSSSELYAAVAPHIDPSVAALTYSWEGGLVEVSLPGVNKRSGLEWLISNGYLPASGSRIAFGDMPNDLEMLRWADIGVAMGNAAPDVVAAADTTTCSNDEDGVADVLEHWF